MRCAFFDAISCARMAFSIERSLLLYGNLSHCITGSSGLEWLWASMNLLSFIGRFRSGLIVISHLSGMSGRHISNPLSLADSSESNYYSDYECSSSIGSGMGTFSCLTPKFWDNRFPADFSVVFANGAL